MSPVAEGAIIASELILTLVQAYMLAQKVAGKSDEEAIAEFPFLYAKFMAESEKPVDPVKE